MKQLTIVLGFLLCVSAGGRDYYVGGDGRDSNTGSGLSPFKTIHHAVGVLKPGDTLYLRGGRYREPVEVRGLVGAADRPITIAAAPGARVVFDGTDALPDAWEEVAPDSPGGRLIQVAQWERLRKNNGKLFSLKLNEPIHALIYDGQLMSDARWPDARWDDPWRLDRYTVLRRADVGSRPGELLDGFPTENALEESTQWIRYDRAPLIDARQTLAETELDFTGSV
ncbi:MAG: hypothetical protein ACYTGQ_08150, partial [Planctomycetota bacterium]